MFQQIEELERKIAHLRNLINKNKCCLEDSIENLEDSIEAIEDVSPIFDSETQVIPYTGIEVPTVSGVNIGDTMTVLFNDNQLVYYKWNGTNWARRFFHPLKPLMRLSLQLPFYGIMEYGISTHFVLRIRNLSSVDCLNPNMAIEIVSPPGVILDYDNAITTATNPAATVVNPNYIVDKISDNRIFISRNLSTIFPKNSEEKIRIELISPPYVMNGLVKAILYPGSFNNYNSFANCIASASLACIYGVIDSNELEPDKSYIDLEANKSGRASMMVGDAEAYADFIFTITGVVTLLHHSSNVYTSLQTGINHIIIKDNGTNVRIVNEMGDLKSIKVNVEYTN